MLSLSEIFVHRRVEEFLGSGDGAIPVQVVETKVFYVVEITHLFCGDDLLIEKIIHRFAVVRRF